MMAENNLLCVLLSKESTSNAVLWEPDLLLSPPTVSQSRSSLSLEAQMSGNKVDDHGRENKDDCAMENLTVSEGDVPCQIVASMEAHKNACYPYSPFDEELVEDLDADEDDLPVGLKIDSGTLPCVACGILGYPFMAVVQPSELAHKELFHVNCEQSHQNLGNSSCSNLPSFLPSSGCKIKSDTEKNESKLGEQANPDSSRELSPECVGHVRISEGRSSRDGTELPNSDVQLPNLLDGKTSKSEHGFCRPRIFCLQHALEIEELLQCKGGANVLIICHSDYIKIKAYTTSVAEEVGMQFNFKDIPLENASACDLDLINISISDEGHDEHDEDWSSKLGMNLRYSVRPRNQSVSKQEKLSVILCRMFSDHFPPAFSTLKWQSKRSRTPYKVVGVSLSKSYIDVNIEKSESVVRNTNTDSTVKLQVYQSRKRKANAVAIKYFGHLEGIPDNIDCRNDTDCRENYLNKQEDDKNSDELFSVPISAAEDLQMYQDSCEPLGVSNLDKIVDPCRSETCSPNIDVPVLEISEMHQENFTAEEYGTWSDVSTSGKSECQAKIVEPEYKNIEVQHETGVVAEINSGYEFENTSCSESEIIQHTSASGERNLEGSLCNPLLPANQPCDNSEVQPEVFAAGKPDSSVDHSSKVEERFSVEEFGTKSKFDTATSEKSLSQGNLSKPEAKVPEVQLGARATDANSSQHEGHNSSDSSCVSKKIQNIPISQEPDLVGILENSLLSVDQPSAPVLSYDDNNLERRLGLVNAETHNKGVNVKQSSKLEGQTVSNWSTVDQCELQKVEPPTPEENGGDRNSQLNSRSETTSSQRQLENLPTDERTDVTHGIPVVDNSSMNSSHIVPISVLDKTEMKTADGLKWCRRNMHSVDIITYVRRRHKRKLEEEQVDVVHHNCSSFIRGPCEGLRPRSGRIAAPESADIETMEKATPAITKRLGKDKDKKSYVCDMEGCRMGFRRREELQLHLKSLCTHKGCRKQFKSHKHLMQHQRVHLNERPLKCPWERCEKSFKWAWARTEHIRLHTGERPYKCRVAGCGETFRFVSDFSRHRRKTGHIVNSTDQ